MKHGHAASPTTIVVHQLRPRRSPRATRPRSRANQRVIEAYLGQHGMTDTASTELTHGSSAPRRSCRSSTSTPATARCRCSAGSTSTSEEGEVVVVLGANGAGKTTSAGDLRHGRGPPARSASTAPRLVGKKAGRRRPPRASPTSPRAGARSPTSAWRTTCMVGAFIRKDKDVQERHRAVVRRRSRSSGERRTQQAGTLSGGEQQMLAVARALHGPAAAAAARRAVARPRADDRAERLRRPPARSRPRRGTTMLVVEQNANIALEDRRAGLRARGGQIVLTGTAERPAAERRRARRVPRVLPCRPPTRLAGA